MRTANYPLAGLKVVEMGTHVAIPNAARIMAEFGADVIKVEAAGGDPWRFPGEEFSVPTLDDENPFFAMQNANKRLISLNIQCPQAVAVLKRLLSNVDVFMTSIRQQSLEKHGLSYDQLRQEFPRLIYCHNTGYGYEGAEAWRPGFDQASFWARTGALCDWVEDGASPFRPSVGFGDMATGAQLLSGVLMALLGREKTGKGTLVSSSLLGCGIWYNSNGIISAQDCYGHHYPESRTNPKNPFTCFFQAQDGEWFAVVSFVDKGGFEGLLRKMLLVFGIQDWVEELGNGTFSHDNVEITARLRAEVRKRPSQEWYQILRENDVAFEPCVHLKDVSKDTQAWANHYLQNVEFQNGHRSVIPRSPIYMSEYDKKEVRAMGPVGADTSKVLALFGYSDDEIHALKEQGAVK